MNVFWHSSHFRTSPSKMLYQHSRNAEATAISMNYHNYWIDIPDDKSFVDNKTVYPIWWLKSEK